MPKAEASQPGHEPNTALVTDALRRNRDGLRAFVRARVAAHEIDDVLQTAALRALERAPTLLDPDRIEAWLFRVHRNIVTDTLRRRARRQRLHEEVASEPKLPSSAVGDTTCDCSVALARGMKPNYATILALVDMGDATVAEAANELGISANNAAVRLHRARKALEHRLREHCGVSSVRECAGCRCVDDGCCVS